MKEGWEIKKLSEVCEKITDGTHQTPKYFDEGFIFLSSKNVTSGKIDWDNVKYIDEKQHLEMHKRVAPKVGDILLAKNGTTGVAAIVDKDVVFDIYVSLAWLRSKGEVTPEYLLRFINSPLAKKQFNKRLKGIGVPNLHLQEIREVEITFPKSLPEQQRIVSILDRAFAAIDQAKANAQKNLQNAKELFESYLQGVFTEIFQKKEVKKIKELAKVVGGYSFKSKDFHKTGKYQVIRMGNVRPGIIRKNESPVFIDNIDEKVLSKALLHPNDVIITQTGTKNKRDYGFTVIIESSNYLLNQRIAAIRFSQLYIPKFFLYFSWTNIFKDQYFANETGTVGQGNVGIGAITDSLIPFLPINEQKETVAKIDLIIAETQKLQTLYEKKIAALDELKKSILQKAFQGELKMSESGLAGLKDEQDLLVINKSGKSSNQINPDPDKHPANPPILKS